MCELTLYMYHKLCCRIVRKGTVPRHLAFIMDGNRRYAQELHKKSIEGHIAGSDTLNLICQSCVELGVEFVTVFAFSLDNFNRPSDEVSGLMALIEEKFNDKVWLNNFICEHNVRVVGLGDLHRAPPSVTRAVKEVEERTSSHNGMVLTIAFCYGSRRDMMSAIKTGAISHKTALSAFDEDDTESHNIVNIRNECVKRMKGNLSTKNQPSPDILIRTSGETRLSDFLTWETSEGTTFHFVKTLWPEFTPFHLCACVLQSSIFGF